MPTKRRKGVTKRNTTRSKSQNTLTDEQKQIVCTKYFNAHQSFEKDLEEKLKKQWRRFLWILKYIFLESTSWRTI